MSISQTCLGPPPHFHSPDVIADNSLVYLCVCVLSHGHLNFIIASELRLWGNQITWFKPPGRKLFHLLSLNFCISKMTLISETTLLKPGA